MDIVYFGKRYEEFFMNKGMKHLEGTYENMNIKNFDNGKNTILYGPPGTGKTYSTVLYAVAIIEKRNYQKS